MTPFTRPELVLRRCEELLSVGQTQAALASVSEVFSSKRFRSTPLSTLEPILLKFIDLCVELKKGRTAKEGLHLYKNVAQNTSVGSVEVVIKHFLAQSKGKLAAALAKVDELEGPAPEQQQQQVAKTGDDDATATTATQLDVDDLEAANSPESILLSAVSDDKSRDRTYRAVVTPWLRFLWEAYRTALDILRNNARLEVLYQSISYEAFQFCVTHQRKTEFRRLAETLRSHLVSSQKNVSHPFAINLNDPETLQRHLDTRFGQLNTAVGLELWQEAFRTAEDIHGLLGMSRRAPRNSMMASFFDKMVRVFGVGQNYLFHAAAYSKLYGLHTLRVTSLGDKASDGDVAEYEKLASLVLLSTLSIPLTQDMAIDAARRREGGIDEGEARGKLGRLSALLGFSTPPTRASLLDDIVSRHVLKRVAPEIRELYKILEVDFHPLSITSKMEPILAALAAKPETARYVEPLKNVVVARLFQQLSQVYATIKIERIVKLASFEKDDETHAIARQRVERFITEACRQGEIDVTIDQANGFIRFDEDLFNADVAPIASTSKGTGTKALQPSAALLVRSQLPRLASALFATLDVIAPGTSPLSLATAAREHAFAALKEHGEDERDKVRARKKIIAKRKELADVELARKEKEDAVRRAQQAAVKAEEDAQRQKDDLKRKEVERAKKEIERVRLEDAKKLAESLKQKSGLKVDLDNVENLDSAKLVQLQVEQIEKEKRDLNTKLTATNKRIDHVERALRREEIPLLKRDYERQQKNDKIAHESAQQLRVETLKRQHTEELEIKQRLARIMPQFAAFRERTEATSRAEFEKKKKAAEEKKAKAKAERREQVLAERERERQRIEAEERAAAEERARREEEERERAEAEAAEAAARQAAEDEARQKREAEQAEAERRRQERLAEREADQARIKAQLAREQEAEERRRQRNAAPAPEAPARAIPGTAAWRRGDAPASVDAPSGGRGYQRLNLAPRKAPAESQNQPPAPARTATPPARDGTPPTGGAPQPWRPRGARTETPPEGDGFKTVQSGGKYVPPSRNRGAEGERRFGGQSGQSRW